MALSVRAGAVGVPGPTQGKHTVPEARRRRTHHRVGHRGRGARQAGLPVEAIAAKLADVLLARLGPVVAQAVEQHFAHAEAAEAEVRGAAYSGPLTEWQTAAHGAGEGERATPPTLRSEEAGEGRS